MKKKVLRITVEEINAAKFVAGVEESLYSPEFFDKILEQDECEMPVCRDKARRKESIVILDNEGTVAVSRSRNEINKSFDYIKKEKRKLRQQLISSELKGSGVNAYKIDTLGAWEVAKAQEKYENAKNAFDCAYNAVVSYIWAHEVNELVNNDEFSRLQDEVNSARYNYYIAKAELEGLLNQ